MFIVSEEILERLICFQCKKYLSVKPIKVYPNRGIKCGRCSDSADAGVVSLFGLLAEQALFRCVNRFEGCNQLLSYSDVENHEKVCVGKEYDCPCCIELFKGTGYDLYIHFRKHHAEQLLINTPEFVVEIDNELIKTYLFRKNDLLFYVNARYNKSEDELVLNVTYFGTDLDASKIYQMFTLYSLEGKIKHKTTRKSCCSVTSGNLKCFKINIAADNFSKNVIVCRFDLDTEYVEKLVALPEYLKKIKPDLDVELKSQSIKCVIMPSAFRPNHTKGTESKGYSFKPVPVSTTTSILSPFCTVTISHPVSGFGTNTTSNPVGVLGTNTVGMLGTYPTSKPVGVLGTNTVGMLGTNTTNNPVAVVGTNNTSNPVGLFGTNTTSNHVGVLGTNTVGMLGTNTTSNPVGVLGTNTVGMFGTNNTSNPVGVFGTNTTSNPVGVFGTNTTSSQFPGAPSSSIFGSSSGVNQSGFGLGTPSRVMLEQFGVFSITTPTTTTSRLSRR